MREKFQKLIAFLRDWRSQSRYLRWMAVKTRPYIGSLGAVLGFEIVGALLGVFTTVVNKQIIDGATGAGNIRAGLILLVALTLVNIGFSALASYLSTFINERYAFGIRSRVFDSVLRSDWMKIDSFHTGDLQTRLTSDIDGVANGVASIVPGFILLVVRLVSAFCVLFYYDKTLALFALTLGPAGALMMLAFTGRMQKLQLALKESESDYRSFMQETMAQVLVIKAFEREDATGARLSALRQRRLNLVLKSSKLSALMGLCMRLFFSLGYLVAFGFSIVRLSTGAITYGTMTVFLSLVSQVQNPIMGLARVVPQFISVLTSAKRVMEIDGLPCEARGENREKVREAGLRIEHVTFAYDREEVLRDVSLDIRPGDVVGVMGLSGAGKTTLIRLVLSLAQPERGGSVRFYSSDGLSEPATASARRLISYVPQGNTLSSGTIYENLLTGRENATETEMWEALSVAQAADFVRALPEGLHTKLRERAGGLSEGQAQRIAIARALLRDAPILILDEATSALDEQTETEMLLSLKKSGRMRTGLVITHRRSMLSCCNRAVEIEDGRVREIPIK